MIKYNPKHWFSLLFITFKGDAFKMLFPIVLVIGLLTAGVAFLELEILNLNYKATLSIHSLVGIVLGLFLVFRTNTAYDRWWEGRKKLGELVNTTRNLGIQLNAMLNEEAKEERQEFYELLSSYVFAMKEHLREGVKHEELISKEDFSNVEHVPNAIAAKIYKLVSQLHIDKKITEEQYLSLDKKVMLLTDIIGACERIKNTPIPFSYSLYMKKFIFTYTITMPIGFVPEYEYWSVPIVMFVFYFLVVVELIAEEIEDPFGKDENDLPVEELCVKIDGNVKELLVQ
jgi:putative membrane protein